MNLSDMQVEHRFNPGLYDKKMTLPGGHVAKTHKHNFDHISMLYSGVASVTVDGELRIMRGPDFVLIRAGQEHTIVAMTDITWYCIHQTDVTDPDQIDHTLIKGETPCHSQP